MTAFDPAALIDVIGGRDRIHWFSPGWHDGSLAGPTDLYLTTTDGEVTWGWRIEPVPVDTGERRFRRFRHPDGWIVLTDAADPRSIFIPSTIDLHTVEGASLLYSTPVESGAAPGPGEAYELEKAAAGGTYRLYHGWPADRVSEGLALWCEVFLGAEVSFESRAPTGDEETAIDRIDDTEEVVDDPIPLGPDEEVAEILAGYDDVFWFQADLTWPDRDDAEAFRDRIDVRLRDEGVDTWLLAIEPLDGSPGSARVLSDGGVMVLDPADPTVMRLGFDRTVLAVSVQETGFEPAGVAVVIGSAPGTDQWDELRRVRTEHEGSVVIHAPAWSETRVSLALGEWCRAWTGLDPRFVYDFDDPIPQAAIDANNALEDAAPAARSIRTSTRQTCGHTDDPQSPHEVPIPCGLPATAYYLDDGEPVLVCDEHSPSGVKLTTLLRA
ncbi:MAG TPA: hypothetical protein VLB67_01700 [Acidimicrobiia bacterium]|nr:hypothetical protein [Acidimicrobiia bacterium]